jgi:choline dehydrogenase
VLDAVAEAAQQAGIPATSDFNRGDNEGVGYFEVNAEKGLALEHRQGLPAAHLLCRPNFELWNNAQVCKLVIAPQADGGQRCTGAEVWAGDGDHGASTRDSGHMGEVILCAGSIGSPQILQLSGIGPAALLQQHGIPCCDLPGVGANLQDHLQIRSVFKVKDVPTLKAWGLSLNTMAASGARPASGSNTRCARPAP